MGNEENEIEERDEDDVIYTTNVKEIKSDNNIIEVIPTDIIEQKQLITTNKTNTIGLESIYNEIELWLLSSSSFSHQQQEQEKEKEQFSHVIVDSNNINISNDNIRKEYYYDTNINYT